MKFFAKQAMRCLLLSLLVIGLGLLAGCSKGQVANKDQAQGQVITLKVADHLAPDHPYMKNGSVAFMDQVTKESGGRIQFKYFPSEQAGAMKDQVNMVKTGIVDIAGAPAAIFADQVPLSNAPCLPGWNRSTLDIAQAYYNLVTDPSSATYQNDYQKNNIRVLVATAFPYYQFQTSKKEIKAFNDIKGLRLRSPGGSMDLVISAMGGVPVAMPPVELYEAMQRGTIDGMYSPQDSMKPQKLDEVSKYSTQNLNVNSFIMQWVISEEAWSKIPPDLQEMMTKIGAQVSASLSQTLDQAFDSSRAELQAAGMTFYQLPEAELTKINNACANVAKEWAKKMDTQGLAGTKALAEFQTALDQVD